MAAASAQLTKGKDHRMAEVSHRTRTEPVYDGSTGAQIDEKTLHEIGITHNGAFVSFLSKEGDYLDRQAEIANAQKKAAESDAGEAKSDASADEAS
jgi:hypothetical protein